MHIGFLTPEYPYFNSKESIGGIGTFTRSLAQQLLINKHQVSVFLFSQKETKRFVEDGINIHLIKKESFPFLTWYINRKHVQKYLNNIIYLDKIDVIEAPEWTGFTAFIKLNVPLILRLHGSDTYFCKLENRKVKFKNFYYERKALLQADKIVGVSYFIANETKKIFKLKKELNVIHNAIDISLFTPNHTQIKKNTLLYFGTIIRKKGVLEIAPVFNKLISQNSKIKLIFLGNDSIDVFEKKSTLELFKNQLSAKAKKNFLYIKAVPYHKIIDYITQAEVILLPSFAEAFPMAWLEAMALEKKIITSNIGWAKELMLDGETGYTVNPKNHKEFIYKINKLLQSNTPNRFAKNARNRITKNFNLKHSIEKNIKIYKESL